MKRDKHLGGLPQNRARRIHSPLASVAAWLEDPDDGRLRTKSGEAAQRNRVLRIGVENGWLMRDGAEYALFRITEKGRRACREVREWKPLTVA